MAKIFVLGGQDVGRSFDVGDGADLGRSPQCAIRLHDRSVSRRHARIERDGDGWVVVDLGSRNGVRVEGRHVERAPLADRDEIHLGELLLRFRTEVAEGASAPPAGAAAPPPPAPPHPPPGAPPRDPRPALGGETGAGDGGFTLEEDIDLTASAPAPAGAPGAPASARGRRRIVIDPEAHAPNAPADEDDEPAELSERERVRAEILAQGTGAGVSWLNADLSQSPVWVRWPVYGLVLALLAGAAFGAFKLVEFLRGSL